MTISFALGWIEKYINKKQSSGIDKNFSCDFLLYLYMTYLTIELLSSYELLASEDDSCTTPWLLLSMIEWKEPDLSLV